MSAPPDHDDLLTALPGVGPARAAALRRHHGSELWRRLEVDPAQALACPGGLPPARVAAAVKVWTGMHTERALRHALEPHGLAWLIATLTSLHGERAPLILRQDPYSIVLLGATLRQADALASGVCHGGELTREEAAAHIVLREHERRGNSCMAKLDVLQAAADMLRVDRLDPDALSAAARSGRLVIRSDCVWTARAHALETRVAEHLHRLTRSTTTWPALITDATRLSPAQARALAAVWSSGFSVCTGKAGTGKTHVIAELCAAARRAKLRVSLCAPTGRAARNLENVTGVEASTIHRLIDWTAQDAPTRSAIPLESELIVVDEASLLDLELFGRLLDVVPDGCHVALFGDPTQLPSVGPGRVLADIVDSAELPVVELARVVRQSTASTIARAAIAISDGHVPGPGTRLADGGDFEIRTRRNAGDVAQDVVRLVRDELPTLYDLDPLTEILVLTPGKRGAVGTAALNNVLAEAVNPEAQRSAEGIAGGDRVMWTSNDPQLGLTNGTVLLLEPSNTAPGEDGAPIRAIAEDGRPLLIPAERKGSMIPAWALTVHKAQGVEVPVVVLAMHSDHTHPALLSRAMLYTAVTRASRVVVICADQLSLDRAVATGSFSSRRLTGLGRRVVSTAARQRRVAAAA